MFEIKCENCGEVNQFHDRTERANIKCHICKEFIKENAVDVKNIKEKTNEFTKISRNYSISENVIYWYDSDSGDLQVEGEIINTSNKNYSYSSFNISFYDENNIFIGTADISIWNFCKGQKRSFMAMTSISENSNIDHYKISFSYQMKNDILGLFGFRSL